VPAAQAVLSGTRVQSQQTRTRRAQQGPPTVPQQRGGDKSGPGSDQGVQPGAAADGARDGAGGKATTRVQGPPRRQGHRVDWWPGRAHRTAEAGTGILGRAEAPGEAAQGRQGAIRALTTPTAISCPLPKILEPSHRPAFHPTGSTAEWVPVKAVVWMQPLS